MDYDVTDGGIELRLSGDMIESLGLNRNNAPPAKVQVQPAILRKLPNNNSQPFLGSNTYMNTEKVSLNFKNGNTISCYGYSRRRSEIGSRKRLGGIDEVIIQSEQQLSQPLYPH